MEIEHAEIIILATSDLHGNILPINYANNQKMELGLAKVSTLIRQEQEQHPYTLLIDNGDLIQGSPLTYHHARIRNKPINPMIKALNELSYDAAVFGNHEFNYGKDVLEKSVRESKFPWLSANVLDRQSKKPYFGVPYLVKKIVTDVTVAILGLTTHYIPNWENAKHIGHLEFQDAVQAAKKWVKYIREKEHPDLLIVSYHGGFECDLDGGQETEPLTGENQGYQLCMEIPEIDILLTGHQHRAIEGKQINGVTILQPASKGLFLGKVRVGLQKTNGKWNITGKSSELLSVKDVEPDPNLLKWVEAYEKDTQNWLDKPIGKVNGDMLVRNPLAIRLKDSALVEFINKVQMENAHAEISNTALFDNDVRGFKPEITMRDIVSNYVNPVSLRVLRVTGQDIKDALEQTAAYFQQYDGGAIQVSPSFTTPKPQHYNYDMWEGIEYKLNISRPVGKRVAHLFYKGKPLEMKKEYEVVMNSYRASGGGNYFMFRGKPVVADIPTDVSELIANYIVEKGTIEATVNYNWEVIHDG